MVARKLQFSSRFRRILPRHEQTGSWKVRYGQKDRKEAAEREEAGGYDDDDDDTGRANARVTMHVHRNLFGKIDWDVIQQGPNIALQF